MNEGWNCLIQTLDQLTEKDLDKGSIHTNQGHTVLDAINRQLAHTTSHTVNCIYRQDVCGNKLDSLSIPKGKSNEFNAR
jgi:hypothetical protein